LECAAIGDEDLLPLALICPPDPGTRCRRPGSCRHRRTAGENGQDDARAAGKVSADDVGIRRERTATEEVHIAEGATAANIVLPARVPPASTTPSPPALIVAPGRDTAKEWMKRPPPLLTEAARSVPPGEDALLAAVLDHVPLAIRTDLGATPRTSCQGGAAREDAFQAP
jgi:hypothetical protein